MLKLFIQSIICILHRTNRLLCQSRHLERASRKESTHENALSFIEFLFKSFCFPSKGNILENRKKIILQQKLFNYFFYNLIENEIKNSSLQMRFNIVLRIVDGQIFLFLNGQHMGISGDLYSCSQSVLDLIGLTLFD